MSQTLLLNILYLSVLVGLFASIQLVRASARLQLWIVAWLAMLLRFAVLLWQPGLPVLARVQDAVATSLLVACALSFLCSSASLDGKRHRLLVGLLLGVPAFTFVSLSSFGVEQRPVLIALVLLPHVVALLLVWRLHSRRVALACTLTALLLLGSQTMLYAVAAHRSDDAVNYLLAELFVCYAVLFAAERPRLTAGVLSTGIALVFWGAVFPVSMMMAHFWPHTVVVEEVWNAPKFIVALGMLVTLLEEETALASAERTQYQMLFRNNPLPMWISERSGHRLLEVNEAAVSSFGYTRQELLELAPGEVLLDGAQGQAQWLEREQSAGPLTLRTAAGEQLLVQTAAQPVPFAGHQGAVLVLLQDVTERERLHEQLIHQANHDPLTGLPNRLLLADRMQKALAAAARHNTRAAVICMDLDRFKQINDTYGHAAGDSCLKEAAVRLKQRLRTVDTAARTGGEEFMVILEQIKSPEDAQRVTEELLMALRVPHIAEGHCIRMTGSVGIALYPDDARHSDDLWRMADEAMYRAKSEGGDGLRFVARGVGQGR